MPNLQAKGVNKIRGLICAWLPCKWCSHYVASKQRKQHSTEFTSWHANTHCSQRGGQIHTGVSWWIKETRRVISLLAWWVKMNSALCPYYSFTPECADPKCAAQEIFELHDQTIIISSYLFRGILKAKLNNSPLSAAHGIRADGDAKEADVGAAGVSSGGNCTGPAGPARPGQPTGLQCLLLLLVLLL